MRGFAGSGRGRHGFQGAACQFLPWGRPCTPESAMLVLLPCSEHPRCFPPGEPTEDAKIPVTGGSLSHPRRESLHIKLGLAEPRGTFLGAERWTGWDPSFHPHQTLHPVPKIRLTNSIPTPERAAPSSLCRDSLSPWTNKCLLSPPVSSLPTGPQGPGVHFRLGVGERRQRR